MSLSFLPQIALSIALSSSASLPTSFSLDFILQRRRRSTRRDHLDRSHGIDVALRARTSSSSGGDFRLPGRLKFRRQVQLLQLLQLLQPDRLLNKRFEAPDMMPDHALAKLRQDFSHCF